jgi:hypothetical protein
LQYSYGIRDFSVLCFYCNLQNCFQQYRSLKLHLHQKQLNSIQSCKTHPQKYATISTTHSHCVNLKPFSFLNISFKHKLYYTWYIVSIIYLDLLLVAMPLKSWKEIYSRIRNGTWLNNHFGIEIYYLNFLSKTWVRNLNNSL